MCVHFKIVVTNKLGCVYTSTQQSLTGRNVCTLQHSSHKKGGMCVHFNIAVTHRVECVYTSTQHSQKGWNVYTLQQSVKGWNVCTLQHSSLKRGGMCVQLLQHNSHLQGGMCAYTVSTEQSLTGVECIFTSTKQSLTGLRVLCVVWVKVPKVIFPQLFSFTDNLSQLHCLVFHWTLNSVVFLHS